MHDYIFKSPGDIGITCAVEAHKEKYWVYFPAFFMTKN